MAAPNPQASPVRIDPGHRSRLLGWMRSHNPIHLAVGRILPPSPIGLPPGLHPISPEETRGDETWEDPVL